MTPSPSDDVVTKLFKNCKQKVTRVQNLKFVPAF